MNSLLNNPGFSQITRKILICLDQENLESCRLVSNSWKFHVDQPCLWIKKLDQKGQSKELHDAWIDSLNRIEEGSSLNQELALCTMIFCQKFHLWKQDQLNGTSPIFIAARYGFTNIVKFMASYGETLNLNAKMPGRPREWTIMLLAARHGYTEIVKFLAPKVKNPNAPTHDGWTPIQMAAAYGYT